MAIAACRECGADVSDSAKTCPKCGVAKPVKPIKKDSLLAKILLAAFVIALFRHIMDVGSGNDGADSPAQATDSTTREAPATASSGPKRPLTFVRAILNASPSAVRQELGNPDDGLKATADCGDEQMKSCDHATYDHGKFEAIFYRNHLKALFIYDGELFGKNALELIGFPGTPPTFSNQFVQSWRSAAQIGTATGPIIPIKGIDFINVSPSHPQKNIPGFMVITVSVPYNKSFAPPTR